MVKPNYCVKCGKQISSNANRCRKHARIYAKTTKSPPNCCIICGKRITSGNHTKCVKCFNKIPWNKGTKGVMVAWNKGLTKDSDERVKINVVKSAKARKGKHGHAMSEENKKMHSQRMMGENNPAKRQEVKEKIRQSVNKMYIDHPEILENRKASGINQFSGHMTSIEKKIYDVLQELHIINNHNYRIGKYFADFLIMDNVVLECDGRYWHKDKEKDARKNSYLHNRGYYVFRFDEDRINKDPIECVKNTLGIMSLLKLDPPPKRVVLTI